MLLTFVILVIDLERGFIRNGVDADDTDFVRKLDLIECGGGSVFTFSKKIPAPGSVRIIWKWKTES